jgi:hypothetical protein
MNKMGAVGLTAMLLSYVHCICKSVALCILDVALHNSHALHIMQNEKSMPLPDFELSAIRGLPKKKRNINKENII